MRGSVATKKRETNWSWLAPAILVGLGVFVTSLLFGRWLSKNAFSTAVLTTAVFWSVTTSFKRRWSDPRFWGLIGLFALLHALLLWVLLQEGIILTRQGLTVVGLTEAFVMALAIAMAFRGKDFLKEIE